MFDLSTLFYFSIQILTLWILARAGGLRKEFTTDGLHLSPAGYAAWSGALAEYLV